MPPSRELTFRLDPAAQESLERHLGIDKYRVIVRRRPSGTKHGHHQRATRTITLELGAELLSGSRLTAVTGEILETLLHEFRHAYQHTHWSPERIAKDKRRAYEVSEMEKDANEWSKRNIARWRHLGRVTAKSSSRLGRLAQAERNVK